MQPIALLRAEHEVILRVLGCLESMADDARRLKSLDAGRVAEALDFLRTFADTCHHHKEEAILFPRLQEQGAGAPVAVMLQEHEAGRGLVRAMAAAQATGDAAGFARAADEFVPLLRNHIIKENMILFPLAERLLTPAMMEQVAAGFEIGEAAQPAGTHERMLDLADRLCAAFKP